MLWGSVYASSAASFSPRASWQMPCSRRHANVPGMVSGPPRQYHPCVPKMYEICRKGFANYGYILESDYKDKQLRDKSRPIGPPEVEPQLALLELCS